MSTIDLQRNNFYEKMQDKEFREKFKEQRARLYIGLKRDAYEWLSQNCYDSCVFCEAPADEDGYCIICRGPIW